MLDWGREGTRDKTDSLLAEYDALLKKRERLSGYFAERVDKKIEKILSDRPELTQQIIKKQIYLGNEKVFFDHER